MFHIFHDAVDVFHTSNLHIMHVLTCTDIFKICIRINPVNKNMSGIKNLFKRKLYLKIILSRYLFNFYALKTLPYTLLLYGKDFGELRHKNPILPCGLVA